MKKCIKQFDTGYNINKEVNNMKMEKQKQMLIRCGFKPESNDSFVKWYRLGTISGLEDFIPEQLNTDEFLHAEILDPTYIVYRVNLADETTKYAFASYGVNVNNLAFIEDAQDPDTFNTVMQLIAKDQLFTKLPVSFHDMLEVVASFEDFDVMQITQDWSGIMVGDDFYQVDVQKGQYVVRFENSEDSPDSYFFVTDSEAQKILGCADSVEALDAVSSFLDWEVQI